MDERAHETHGLSSYQRVDTGSGVAINQGNGGDLQIADTFHYSCAILGLNNKFVHEVKHRLRILPTCHIKVAKETFLNKALIIHVPDNCKQTGGTIGPRVGRSGAILLT